MIDFIKKHYRGITLSFLVGLLLPTAIAPTLKADVSSENYFDGIETVDEVVVQYHLMANAIVNSSLSFLTDEDYQDVAGTIYVSPTECSENNISTYCLAVLLDELLVDFEEKLHDMEDDLQLDENVQINENSIVTALSQATKDKEQIAQEIQVANDTLDLTLAVYNQVQTVYPIHKELADLIINLEAYRDNLAAIRSQMELYPSRFNNATSATCT